MNLEFHYYVVHLLALKAGLGADEAETIAASSQYVDKAILGYRAASPTREYDTVITQNYLFWDDSTARNAYLPFHFIPSGHRGPAPDRADLGENPFVVLPDSEPAKEILIAALKTRNPYRVGIALHSYADTWAHQNFSGLHEAWNLLDPALPWPTTGHAQALSNPDRLDVVWEDPRLISGKSRIRNRDRFIKAAAKIYKYLRTYNRTAFGDVDSVMEDLERAWGPRGKERPMAERVLDYRIRGVSEYDGGAWTKEAGIAQADDNGDSLAGYDKLKWFGRELGGRIGLARRERVVVDGAFFSSKLYAWCVAAAEHRAFAQDLLKERGLLP
jgi:hypothetical protein